MTAAYLLRSEATLSKIGDVEEVRVIHADGSEGVARLKIVGISQAQQPSGGDDGAVQGQSTGTP